MTDAFGGYGGIAQYNRDLVSALATSNRVSEVVLVPRFGSANVNCLPAKVHQLDPRKMRSAYIASSIRAAKKFGPFDAIFSGHLYHTPLAVLLGRWMKIPVWLQTHGIEAWECPNPLLRYAAEQCALITTVGRFTKCTVLTWAKVAPERVRVLPNTFRSMFTAGARDENYLKQLGLVDRKIILTVSRLSKADGYKGHSQLIRVLPKVTELHPDAIYMIVGEGDSRVELEQDVADRGMELAVRFMGRLSDDEVLQLYRAASVFAMPSTKEGFGIVFVEAAATGLPVIGGNCDGSADALADGVVGAMINPDDDEALTGALHAALSGAMRADASAVHRFGFDNFALHVDNLVQSLLDYAPGEERRSCYL